MATDEGRRSGNHEGEIMKFRVTMSLIEEGDEAGEGLSRSISIEVNPNRGDNADDDAMKNVCQAVAEALLGVSASAPWLLLFPDEMALWLCASMLGDRYERSILGDVVDAWHNCQNCDEPEQLFSNNVKVLVNVPAIQTEVLAWMEKKKSASSIPDDN